MSENWFSEWADLYCQMTGGNQQHKAVLMANKHTITVEWGASLAELGECVTRMVSGRRVPAWPNEVTNSLLSELQATRQEVADRARSMALIEPPARPACRWCRDTGLVTVPLWKCVEVPFNAAPRLVCYPGYRSVLTGSVLCDSPGCEPGRRVRDRETAAKRDRPRPVLTKYLSRFQGVNVVALLEQHERELAEASGRQGGPNPWAELVAGIRQRVREAEQRRAAA